MKTSFYWGESHALGKGKTSQEKCPLELRSVVAKYCPTLRCSMEAGPLAGPWSRFGWESILVTREGSLLSPTLHLDWLDNILCFFKSLSSAFTRFGTQDRFEDGPSLTQRREQ